MELGGEKKIETHRRKQRLQRQRKEESLWPQDEDKQTSPGAPSLREGEMWSPEGETRRWTGGGGLRGLWNTLYSDPQA